MFDRFMRCVALQSDKPHGHRARTVEPGTHPERQHRVKQRDRIAVGILTEVLWWAPNFRPSR
jgi:hypothetical protein